VLIHIEVQGDYEKDFAERMFGYNMAVYQLYRKPVVSLAVLCDERPDWRATMFGYGYWGSRVELTFRIAKLLDFAKGEALENSDNPFGLVVAAHLQAPRTRGDVASRRHEKLRLVKGLYRGSWTKDDVRELFRLIDWIMTLPEDF